MAFTDCLSFSVGFCGEPAWSLGLLAALVGFIACSAVVLDPEAAFRIVARLWSKGFWAGRPNIQALQGYDLQPLDVSSARQAHFLQNAGVRAPKILGPGEQLIL